MNWLLHLKAEWYTGQSRRGEERCDRRLEVVSRKDGGDVGCQWAFGRQSWDRLRRTRLEPASRKDGGNAHYIDIIVRLFWGRGRKMKVNHIMMHIREVGGWESRRAGENEKARGGERTRRRGTATEQKDGRVTQRREDSEQGLQLVNVIGWKTEMNHTVSHRGGREVLRVFASGCRGTTALDESESESESAPAEFHSIHPSILSRRRERVRERRQNFIPSIRTWCHADEREKCKEENRQKSTFAGARHGVGQGTARHSRRGTQTGSDLERRGAQRTLATANKVKLEERSAEDLGHGELLKLEGTWEGRDNIISRITSGNPEWIGGDTDSERDKYFVLLRVGRTSMMGDDELGSGRRDEKRNMQYADLLPTATIPTRSTRPFGCTCAAAVEARESINPECIMEDGRFRVECARAMYGTRGHGSAALWAAERTGVTAGRAEGQEEGLGEGREGRRRFVLPKWTPPDLGPRKFNCVVCRGDEREHDRLRVAPPVGDFRRLNHVIVIVEYAARTTTGTRDESAAAVCLSWPKSLSILEGAVIISPTPHRMERYGCRNGGRERRSTQSGLRRGIAVTICQPTLPYGFRKFWVPMGLMVGCFVGFPTPGTTRVRAINYHDRLWSSSGPEWKFPSFGSACMGNTAKISSTVNQSRMMETALRGARMLSSDINEIRYEFPPSRMFIIALVPVFVHGRTSVSNYLLTRPVAILPLPLSWGYSTAWFKPDEFIESDF
ncbi:hypothetical protein K438DRAFT_1749112 [Mycena galopus ATCC 62051]|nr:hypothetical protein K438DRAFT_1749112 [Mycena galopus ATCC 62051]